MASLPTGSPSRAVELLRIETNWFNLYLQGKPFHPAVEALQLHRQEDSSWMSARFLPQAISEELELLSVERFSPEERRLVSWDRDVSSPPLLFETQNYELIIELEADLPITFYHDNVSLREAVLPKGKRLLSGILNFQNEVGFTELELRLHGRTVFLLQLEIFPSKMEYKKDYEAILQDVNAQMYNLSFDFLRKTHSFMGLKETRRQSLSEFFVILRQLFGNLTHQVELIRNAPNYQLLMENRLIDSARVKKPGRANVAYLAKRPYLLSPNEVNGQLNVQGQRYSPTRLLETRRHIDYDTPANRFVRWVLLRVQQRLKTFKRLLSEKSRAQDPDLIAQIDKMQNELQRLLRIDFLQVRDMKQLSITLVLQMAPGYRDVYRNYLVLMKGLSIQNDLFRLSLKDLATLYEYWCFLKINDLLSRKYELVSQNVIKLNHGGLFVTLDRTKESRIVYCNPRNGEKFSLQYNALPSGDRSRTVAQRPDNILTLQKEHSAIEYKYVFDAKYRINPAYEGTAYRRDYVTPGPQEDDINTMHRYRDAIVYETAEAGQRADYERAMFGAYVLFPYPNEEEYREHKFYKSIELVNVGALPFLPSATSLMEKFLDELIMDSPEKAYERANQQRGTKDYYADKLSGKTILVGALSHRDQLEDLRKHRFYHVPLKHFSDHGQLAGLEHIAIFQSIAKFGRDQAGIYLRGRIRSWQVLPREQIIEIPSRRNASSELYVRFDVEEWLPLQQPILPGVYGIKHVLVTSAYIFDRAEEVAELRLETDEQLREWREKRRQGKVKVQWDSQDVDQASVLSEIMVDQTKE